MVFSLSLSESTAALLCDVAFRIIWVAIAPLVEFDLARFSFVLPNFYFFFSLFSLNLCEWSWSIDGWMGVSVWWWRALLWTRTKYDPTIPLWWSVLCVGGISHLSVRARVQQWDVFQSPCLLWNLACILVIGRVLAAAGGVVLAFGAWPQLWLDQVSHDNFLFFFFPFYLLAPKQVVFSFHPQRVRVKLKFRLITLPLVRFVMFRIE